MRSLVLFFAGVVAAADLASVKAEPNLEKRSEKALVYAGELLTAMRGELDRGDVAKIKEQLVEFQGAIDLSVESLEATGKNARNNPKYFKRAEVRLRELNRRLATFKSDMGIDDRHLLYDVREHVTKKIDHLVEQTLRGTE